MGVGELRRGRTSSRFPACPAARNGGGRTAMPSSAPSAAGPSTAPTTGTNFWTWREAMYAAAEQLTPEELYAVSKVCFLEMARAGITAVASSTTCTAIPPESRTPIRTSSTWPWRAPLAKPVCASFSCGSPTRRSGFRIPRTAAEALHRGLGRRIPAQPRRPFASRFRRRRSPQRARLPGGMDRDIGQEAFRRGWPLHLHVAEQRGEVEQCQAEHGTTPALAARTARVLREKTTAVHAVHLSERDVAALAARGPPSALVPPRAQPGRRRGALRICCLAAGAGSASEAIPRCSSRRWRMPASSSTTCACCRSRGRSSTGARGCGRPGREALRNRSEGGMRSLGMPGARSGPASRRISSPSTSTIPRSPDATRPTSCSNVVFAMERTAIRETWWPASRCAWTSRARCPPSGPPCEAVGMIDPVAVLRELVAVDSTSARSNLPILDVLERHARALGLTTRRQTWTDAGGVPKGNLIAHRGGEQGGRALVGHTDCVPYDPDWQGALRPTLEGDKLYGRGSADTSRSSRRRWRPPRRQGFAAAARLHRRRRGRVPWGAPRSSPRARSGRASPSSGSPPG